MNNLNTLLRSQKLNGKKWLHYMLSTRNSIYNDTGRFKVKGQKKTYHANANQRKLEWSTE